MNIALVVFSLALVLSISVGDAADVKLTPEQEKKIGDELEDAFLIGVAKGLSQSGVEISPKQEEKILSEMLIHRVKEFLDPIQLGIAEKAMESPKAKTMLAELIQKLRIKRNESENMGRKRK
ncbi:hypothetical protein ES319_D05G342600v1 [Gossypium barbadense]|uniref:Uncharacterized protein n=1 Tax=Gossypium barbadense TaxID=3634 RepID=A0A5J5RTE0_GOSBA|nr:hypothetical protein ES319_D05G342600v1 [Gossypium barbadense]PPD68669.1 hypothetical protein GOBAR_DD34450 [Gossypium barbadense]